MSETSSATRLNERVAEEIRAILARRRLSATELARQMGVTQSYLARRMTGVQPLDLDDIQRVARALDVQPLALFSAAETGSTLRYSPAHIPSPRKVRESRPASRSDSRAPRDGRPRRIGQTYAASRVAS